MIARSRLLLAAALLAVPLAARAQPVALPQGWTQAERELWWNGAQGSQIMPYDWFLKLEQPGTAAPVLFASPANMARYGYLPSGATTVNPDALPIGFSRERDRAGAAWVGMTCGACHVGSIPYKGHALMIEGGGGMVDTQSFDRDLSAALAATVADDPAGLALFARFADRLATPEAGRPALHEALARVAATRAAFTAMNTPPHDHGPGRVDALGVIMNALAATALNNPANARAPDAPVRLPWVWGSPSYTRVQYNGSISNAGLGPLLRNIGQTLGVYGTVDLTKSPMTGYASSVKIAELDTLEALLRRLEPPKWPADILPPIDAAKAQQGSAVFAQNCASCHQGGERNAAGLVPVTLVALDKVGTDPRAARNFMTRPAETGILEGRPVAVFGGAPFGPRAGAATIVGHVSTAVAVQVPKEQLQAGLAAYRTATIADAAKLDSYKAVPLAGVWAGAPYLHNGSVANLSQLLTAPSERALRFATGARDYDPAVVGYPADANGPGWVLDTALPGNSNAGHTYGTTLTEAEKLALLEYLKTL